jgi:hypothetical protein
VPKIDKCFAKTTDENKVNIVNNSPPTVVHNVNRFFGCWVVCNNQSRLVLLIRVGISLSYIVVKLSAMVTAVSGSEGGVCNVCKIVNLSSSMIASYLTNGWELGIDTF